MSYVPLKLEKEYYPMTRNENLYGESSTTFGRVPTVAELSRISLRNVDNNSLAMCVQMLATEVEKLQERCSYLEEITESEPLDEGSGV